jgi:VanZ family protein
VVFWLGVITLESSDLASSRHTGGILFFVMAKLFGPVDYATFEFWHFLLRKSDHFACYGSFSLLVFRAVRATIASNLASLWWAPVAASCVVASLDEWHQSFIPSRTGSVYDVLLDTVAAACVQTVLVTLMYVRRRGLTTTG